MRTAILLLSMAFAANAWAADGAAVFSKRCAGCHGADGKGDTRVGRKYHVADFSSATWAKDWTLAKLKATVSDGVKGKMPAMKSKLSPEELDAVSAYVLGLGKAASK